MIYYSMKNKIHLEDEEHHERNKDVNDDDDDGLGRLIG